MASRAEPPSIPFDFLPSPELTQRLIALDPMVERCSDPHFSSPPINHGKLKPSVEVGSQWIARRVWRALNGCARVEMNRGEHGLRAKTLFKDGELDSDIRSLFRSELLNIGEWGLKRQWKNGNWNLREIGEFLTNVWICVPNRGELKSTLNTLGSEMSTWLATAHDGEFDVSGWPISAFVQGEGDEVIAHVAAPDMRIQSYRDSYLSM